MSLVDLGVGKPWPYPVQPGMQAIIAPAESGIDLTLAAACDRPTAAELTALRDGRLRVAAHQSQALAWIALDAGVISYDAPYAVGLASADHAAAILAAVAPIAAWPETTRRLVTFAVVDRGTIAVMRIVSLSRAWWLTLGAAIAATPHPIERRDYLAAVAADQARWTTKQMLAAAKIIEIAGRV